MFCLSFLLSSDYLALFLLRLHIVILVLLLSSCCCCRGIGIFSGNKEDNESSSVSEVSNESSVAETMEEVTEESTTERSTEEQTSKLETEPETYAPTEKTTTIETTETTAEQETTTTAIEISSESFVYTVKETIKGAVGSDEYITDAILTDGSLTIFVDLSKADTTIVPLEDLAILRSQSITDSFLDLEGYDEFWNEIIIDFGNIGFVKKKQSDIVEDEYYDIKYRYFNIEYSDLVN